MSLIEIIPTAGRYAVLIAILFILREFAYSDSLKFIIYICMLITTFFTIGFLYWGICLYHKSIKDCKIYKLNASQSSFL